MMLDKMQIQEIFLFEYKMACKEAETAHNIHNTFGPETANKRSVQCCFNKFSQGARALKMRSVLAGHWKSTVTN